MIDLPNRDFAQFRGHGFDRAIMLAAEAYVRAAGGDAIYSSVFGNNAFARNLSESLDDNLLQIDMKKSPE
jgi:hypothetical protein